jgi:hypothetical protein
VSITPRLPSPRRSISRAGDSAWIARRARARYPSTRAVAAAIAAVGLVCAGLILWQLLLPRPYYTGTNSVAVHSVVANLNTGQHLCVRGLNVPAETAAVELGLFAHRPTFKVQFATTVGGLTSTSNVVANGGSISPTFVSAPIPVRPAKPESTPGTVCITPLDGPIAVAGMIGLQANQVSPLLDGQPLGSRVSVWFLPKPGAQRSIIDMLGTIFKRAALFRPGFVGAWTYILLMFGLFPLTALASVWLMINAVKSNGVSRARRLLRPGMLIVCIAFLNAATWALITPPFDAPDEPSHFAYAQYLATTGHAPPHEDNTLPEYATAEVVAMNAVDIYSQVSAPEGKPPWLEVNQRQWEREWALVPHIADNGGGPTVAAAPEQPGYYLLLTPAYDLFASGTPFDQLTAMRLFSALLGALVAFCAFGVMREMLPRHRLAAVAAGLLVAYQPMFAFISGAVNNDNGVNAVAALALYLTIRGLRRGLGFVGAALLGVTVALAPAMKGSGYEIYPPLAVGVGGIAWNAFRKRQLRSAAPRLAVLAGAFAAAVVVWSRAQSLFYPPIKGHSTLAGGASPVGALALAEHYPTRFLVYLWELFLPRLPFMGAHFPPGWPFKQVYIIRAFGAFGWYVWEFPNWVYYTIIMVMFFIGIGALVNAIRNRPVLRRRAFEIATIALYPICNLIAVEAVFFEPTDSRTVVAEQGRYIFPAIAALAVIAVSGTFALRGWRRRAAIASLVTAMIGLFYASLWLSLLGAYT